MRKISAHYIFPVISKPLKNGIIHIDGEGTITKLTDTGGRLKEESGLEFYDGIIVPGFVNAHCHLELAHLKNKITPKQGLASFVDQVRNIRNIDDIEIILSIQQADAEMKKNGIAAAGDISNNDSTFSVKRNSSIAYHTFLEVFGLISDKAEAIFNNIKILRNQAIGKDLASSITPHSAYALSEELFKLVSENAVKERSALSIHFLECASEKELFASKSGSLFQALAKAGNSIRKDSDPIDVLINSNLSHNPVLFVHNTFAGNADIKKINKHFKKPYFILCPKSNLYIENCLPDVEMLMKNKVSIAIGTDSPASNDSLSVLEELKILQQYFPFLTLQDLIQFATLNGAKALQMEPVLGSLEKGKKPGINLIQKVDFQSMKLTSSSTVSPLI